MSDTSLITVEARAVTKPMSVMEMEEQIRAYFDMQQVLDKALPGAIMEIQGHLFRKKSYWRAIAVAFGIELEMMSEDRFESNGGWGWKALYKATLPNGKSMTGDGICTSSEKRGNSCTEHNVRSHCHTRAKNRAIADLVGFGEVSAEEVERDEAPPPQTKSTYTPREDTTLSSPVVTRVIYRQAVAPIWKEAQKKGMPKDFWTSLLHTMHINATDVVDEATLDRLRVEVIDFTSVDVPNFDGPPPSKGPTLKDCEELAQARNIGQNQFTNLKAECNNELSILFKDLTDCMVES